MNQDVFKHIHYLLSQLETQQAETQQAEAQQEAHNILAKLKTQFINFNCFNGNGQDGNGLLLEELCSVRETLELCTLLSLIERNEAAFERDCQELGDIYFHPHILEALIVSLILLWHLSRDNIQDFNILSRKIATVHKDSHEPTFFGVAFKSLQEADQILLNFPIVLERDIRDGSIAKVLATLESGLPNPYFKWCTGNLVESLRQRVACSLEVAYESIPITHAMKMLAYTSVDELCQFVQQDNQRKQTIVAETGYFLGNTEASNKSEIVPETPTSLPKAGEGRVFSEFGERRLRLSSAGSLSRTFSVGSKKFSLARTTSSDLYSENRSQDRTKSNHTLYSATSKATQVHWKLTQDKIVFEVVSRPKPLIPAFDIMGQWLSYAVTLEEVV